MKIGLRTIKSGIAVALALMVVQILGRDSVLFVAIGALIGMQPTVSDSWTVGRNRILGTFAGSIFGLVTAMWLPGHFLLAGMGVVLLIMAMNRLKIPEGITISCVVFISIFMNTENAVVPLAMNRLVDTIIGIAIALLVNYFILPPKYDRRAMVEMRKDMYQILSCQNRILGRLLGQESVSVEELDSRIETLMNELNESKKLAEMQEKEEKLNVYGQVLCKELNLVLRITSDMYQHLKNLFGLLEKGLSPNAIQQVKPELSALYEKLTLEETQLQAGNLKQQETLRELIADVALLKQHVKSADVSRELSADEAVTLMVMVYNIGEITSKMEMITSQRYT